VRSRRPPRLAGWLLRRLLPRGRDADAIRGDLIEDFGRHGSAAWFYRDALSTIVQGHRYRRMLTFESLVQDLRYALRGMRKAPGFALVVIVTLALGVGASTAIFSIVNGVLLRPLPLPEPDRLAWANETNGRGQTVSVSWMNYLDWRARAHSFETLAASRSAPFALTGMGQARRLTGRIVTANFFKALGVQPALGRDFSEADERGASAPVAIVSHEFWQRQLNGDPAALGRALVLDARAYVIVGVMPAGFRYLRPYDVFASAAPLVDAEWMRDRGNHQGFVAVGRLRRGVTVEAAAQELRAISSDLTREYPATNAGIGAVVEPLAARLVSQVRQTLLVLLGAVGLLLLIACANVAGLLVARGAARRHELAVRVALGGRRSRIAAQVLVESLLLSFSGGTLGVIVAAVLLRALIAAAPPDTPRLDEVGLDRAALVFAALAATACGLLFGLLPAMQASSVSGQQLVIRTRAAGSSASSHRLRRTLLAAETALALVLLAGAGLMVRTLGRLTDVDLGFTPDHVLTVAVSIPGTEPSDAELVAQTDAMLSRARAIPGVTAAAAGFSIPIDGSNWNSVFWVADKPVPATHENLPSAAMIPVTPDYFTVLGTQLTKGRRFTDADRAGAARVAIVNSALAARMWPGEDPIGKRIAQGWPERHQAWSEVVGVVADMKFEGIAEAAGMALYMPFGQQPAASYLLVARTIVDPRSIVPAIQQAAGGVNPDMPLARILTMDAILGESLARQRLARLVLSVFAAVALTLASIGLFGFVSHTVTERRHELGVRMALGATRARIVRQVLAGGVGTAVAGAGVGVALSLALTRSLADLLYGVEPFDAATFASVTAILLGVAVLACAIPAWRASRTGITGALRAD